MGYLDNSTIVVDAVLTKEGRKRLAGGSGLGIEYFTLSDSGIDYRLWNPDHPSGSAYYGEAIEKLPSLEAIPRAEFYMRNKLITLNKDVTGLPYWDNHGANNIVIDDTTDPMTSTGGYNGIDTLFEFKQQQPGACLLIVENQMAIEAGGITGLEGSCNIASRTDAEGVAYNSLVNLESQTQAYWDITPLGTGQSEGKIRIQFKRPMSQTITTDATIIELTTGIYKTFKITVGPKSQSNN